MQQILSSLTPGSLVFDVGAHHGDKAVRFLERGASVVCIEPLPSARAALKRRFAGEPRIAIVEKAVADKPGIAELLVNSRDPVLSTLSHRWTEGRFADRVWDDRAAVEQTTLDALILAHGLPDFVKIDVEGMEHAVLQGLSLQCRALSYEFTSEFFGDAEACLLRLEQLGYRAFNLCLGEEDRLALPDWCNRSSLLSHMAEKGWNAGDSWGDIYAQCQPAPLRLPTPEGEVCLVVGTPSSHGWRDVRLGAGNPPADVEDLGESWQKPLRALSRATRRTLMHVRPLDLDGWADAESIARIDALALGETATEALMGLQHRLYRRDVERIHLAEDVPGVALELLCAYGYGERPVSAGRLFVAPGWLSAETEDWLDGFDVPAICEAQGFAALPLHRLDGAGALPPAASPERIAVAFDDPGEVPPAWLAARDDVELILAQSGDQLARWDAALEVLGFRRVAETPHASCHVRRPRLSMRQIGGHGRFGNQVLQHFWFQVARHECDAVAGIAPWIGESLFDLPEPPRGDWQAASVATPEWPYIESGAWDPFDLDWGFRHLKRARNADIIGNCQYHTSLLTPWRALYRRMMRPHPTLAPALAAALAALRRRGDTLVACHLRGGDYGTGDYADHPIFYRPPNRWYLQELNAMWPRLHRPVLYIASDEPQAFCGDFTRFAPVTAADLGVDIPIAPYFLDFYILSQADALLIANSTFSFTASMVNDSAAIFLRPDRATDRLVPFDPWNANPVLFPEKSLPPAVPAAGDRPTSEPTRHDPDLALLEARIGALENDIAALRLSLSWRATASLRLLARLIKRRRR